MSRDTAKYIFLTVPLTSRTAYTHPQLLLHVFTSPPTVANNPRDVPNACLQLLSLLFLCLPLLPFLFSVWPCGRFYFLFLVYLLSPPFPLRSPAFRAIFRYYPFQT